MRDVTLRRRRAEAEQAELKARVARGEYISTELVSRTVLDYLEALGLRLLRDVPTTLATRVERLTREERVTLIRDTLSRELTVTRDRIVRALRDFKPRGPRHDE